MYVYVKVNNMSEAAKVLSNNGFKPEVTCDLLEEAVRRMVIDRLDEEEFDEDFISNVTDDVLSSFEAEVDLQDLVDTWIDEWREENR